ncbi:MAG: hypothetical protein IPI00_17780 [Flavobacteriales bacterium]|nr:hypothetical protein [Flavobacteriales bacterium]
MGVLDRSQDIVYEPSLNASLTTFTMTDLEGKSCTVHLNKQNRRIWNAANGWY